MKQKYFALLSILALLASCNNKLDVNASWQDITVVYGLLNQNDSIHYLRITKAYLGPGDALQFAKIPDSSNYPGKLNVRLEEWDITTGIDSTLKNTYYFDTTSIPKDTGTFYYFPYQKVYYINKKLNENYTYKLFITQPKSGKTVTGRTELIAPLTINTPKTGNKAAILPQKEIPLEFLSSKYGRRYQLTIRFYYVEYPAKDTLSIEWQVFNDITSNDLQGGQVISPAYQGDGLYSALKSHLSVDPNITRNAIAVDYILSAGSDDLNTYMNVNAPSTTIVQERPDYTDIVNGIGLFTSIYDNTVVHRLHLAIGQVMQDSLKTNSNTYNLGF
jgi:hypothetical protein